MAGASPLVAGRSHPLCLAASNGGTISQELPRPSDFDAVAESVTTEMATDGVPCGPDPAPVLEQVRIWEQAGFDRIAIHQVGRDQDGFFRFWEQDVRPKLGSSR